MTGSLVVLEILKLNRYIGSYVLMYTLNLKL